MPFGWALQTQSCTRYLIVLATARTHKSLAQSCICKAHCGYYLLLEVPFMLYKSKILKLTRMGASRTLLALSSWLYALFEILRNAWNDTERCNF